MVVEVGLAQPQGPLLMPALGTFEQSVLALPPNPTLVARGVNEGVAKPIMQVIKTDTDRKSSTSQSKSCNSTTSWPTPLATGPIVSSTRPRRTKDATTLVPRLPTTVATLNRARTNADGAKSSATSRHHGSVSIWALELRPFCSITCHTTGHGCNTSHTSSLR